MKICSATYTDEIGTPAVSATYGYDAQGQRTHSQVTVGTQTTTSTFIYGGISLLGLSAVQTGGAENDTWSITYLYDAAGCPYAGIYRDPSTSSTPVVFAMVSTDRGDVVELQDAAGNPFAAYRYDAWGSPQGTGNLATGVWVESTTLISEPLAADIATRQPLRYAGYHYDSESGLYYLSARTYDPRTGQFLSKDPVKTGEDSAYQYCAGNPIGLVDPAGTYASRANDHQESRLGWQLARARAEQAEREAQRAQYSNEMCHLYYYTMKAAQGDETAAVMVLRLQNVPEEDITPEAVQFLIEVLAGVVGLTEYDTNGPESGSSEPNRAVVGMTASGMPGYQGGFGGAGVLVGYWYSTSCYFSESASLATVLAVSGAAGGAITAVSGKVLAPLVAVAWGTLSTYLSMNWGDITKGGITITIKYKLIGLRVYVDGKRVF